MKKLIIIMLVLIACNSQERKTKQTELTPEQKKLIKVVDSYSLEQIQSKTKQTQSKKNNLVMDQKKKIKRKNQKVKPYLKN